PETRRGALPFTASEVAVVQAKTKQDLTILDGEGFAAFGPGGRSLAVHKSSSGRMRVVLIDPRTGRRQQTLEASTKSLALSVKSLTSARSLLATAKALTGTGASDEALFSPDGRLVGVAGEGGFVVWERL